MAGLVVSKELAAELAAGGVGWISEGSSISGVLKVGPGELEGEPGAVVAVVRDPGGSVERVVIPPGSRVSWSDLKDGYTGAPVVEEPEIEAEIRRALVMSRSKAAP